MRSFGLFGFLTFLSSVKHQTSLASASSLELFSAFWLLLLSLLLFWNVNILIIVKKTEANWNAKVLNRYCMGQIIQNGCIFIFLMLLSCALLRQWQIGFKERKCKVSKQIKFFEKKCKQLNITLERFWNILNKGDIYDLLLTLIKSFKTISILMNEGNNHEKDKIRVTKG